MPLSIDQAKCPTLECLTIVQQCGFFDEKCEQNKEGRKLARKDNHPLTLSAVCSWKEL